jgi:3-deoxy-D-manno-octulosonate 8-phosphate phosphatase KdsC-like HAD superfamily phosphatase
MPTFALSIMTNNKIILKTMREHVKSFNVLLGTGNLAVSDKVKINIPVQLLKVA